MTPVSKYVYINELDDVINKYNSSYYRTIKINPTDVQTSTYIKYGVEHNYKEHKFNISDHLKVTLELGLENILSLTKLKILYHEIAIYDVNSEEILGTFHKKELKKNQTESRLEMVTKKKVSGVKWKGNNN